MLFTLLILILIFTGQSVFCRMYTASRRGTGAAAYAIIYTVFVGVCTLILNGFSFRPSGITVAFGIANAVALMIYNLAMVRASVLGSFTFMMMGVLSGGILMPTFYDFLFLGASLTPLRIVAILLMFVALIGMNLDGFRGKKSGKYLMYVAILFVCNGAYSTILPAQQNAMRFTQRNEMLMCTYFMSALLNIVPRLILRPKVLLSEFHMPKISLLWAVLSAACCAAATNLLMLSMQAISVTVLNVAINGGVLAVSAVASFLLFKEKLSLRNTIFILIACVSIVLLSL